jgi:hypothetical protein
MRKVAALEQLQFQLHGHRMSAHLVGEVEDAAALRVLGRHRQDEAITQPQAMASSSASIWRPAAREAISIAWWWEMKNERIFCTPASPT